MTTTSRVQRRAGVFRQIYRHTVGQSHAGGEREVKKQQCLEGCFGSSFLDLEHYLNVLVSDLFDWPYMLQATRY